MYMKKFKIKERESESVTFEWF